MKVLIFGGFLGAGKTTVILQMVRHMVSLDGEAIAKVVLLENEIGGSSVDDKTVAGTGLKVETLFSGCVCCTMAGELIANIKHIEKKFSPEWLVLETTGMAYPSKIKQNIQENFPDMECRLICLADAGRFRRMRKIPELGQFIGDQLEDADVVLINKCDLVQEEELREIDTSVREINDKLFLVHTAAKDGIREELWQEILSWN